MLQDYLTLHLADCDDSFSFTFIIKIYITLSKQQKDLKCWVYVEYQYDI